ncbi:MAG: hypothetical protein IKJ31_08490, partial [Bacteroidaceae bacterium]|nr:hypothetical protein [Bacteroidaceae bacterium]
SAPTLLVMLAVRTPRGYIFDVASRDNLLLALTNQPMAALWESRSSPLIFKRLQIISEVFFSFYIIC